jgi:hypothetical protein
MGSQVRADCPCGYERTFTIGGSMSSYRTHSYFPYRCGVCGIVSVNIAQDPVQCPKNKTHPISRIGGSFGDRIARERAEQERLGPRRRTFLEWLGLRKSPALPVVGTSTERRVRCQWGDHEIYDELYDCPQCGKGSLSFENTGLRFD